MQRLFIFILISICSFNVFGQSFVQQQESIFRTSESQWLCMELEKVNAEHFNCSPKNVSWKLPHADSLSVFDIKVALHDSDKTVFSALLFPNNDCKRYLKIASLCDLYFPLIRKKAEALGLPADYQYLPVLLSGMNTSARVNGSRSGLWSMEYLVARKYGLRIDESVDERNGGDFTIEAALKYIADLHNRFDGDVVKVITAYRKGAPFVSRQDSERGDLSFFDALDDDSKNFIKFYAYTKSVIASTRTENQLSNYFDILGQYEGVFAEDDMQVSAMARVLQVSESSLRLPNPVYTGNTIQSTYRRVPFMLENTIVSKYRMLKDSIARYEPQPIVAAVTLEKKYHTVKKGESLGTIAKKNKVTVTQIKKWNSLRSDNIRAGQRLIVGQGIDAKPKPSVPLSENKPNIPKENSKQDEPKRPKEEVKKKESTAAKEDKSGKITYTVKSGDSLWKIAQRYKGVTDSDLKKWNNCGNKITPGQKLIIYTK